MKVKNFCRGVLAKIKGGAHKVHDKYRAKFPKKVPKLNDGKLHDRKFIFKACNCINFDEFIHRDIRTNYEWGLRWSYVFIQASDYFLI